MTETIGNIVFRVAKANWTRTFDFESLPLETRKRVIEYGAMRLVNDMTAGLADEEGKPVLSDKLEAVLKRIETGDWDESRGGFKKLSASEAVMRETLKATLLSLKFKAADADKLSKDFEAAIFELAKFVAKRDDRGDIETIKEEIETKINLAVVATLEARSKPLV